MANNKKNKKENKEVDSAKSVFEEESTTIKEEAIPTTKPTKSAQPPLYTYLDISRAFVKDAFNKRRIELRYRNRDVKMSIEDWKKELKKEAIYL